MVISCILSAEHGQLVKLAKDGKNIKQTRIAPQSVSLSHSCPSVHLGN